MSDAGAKRKVLRAMLESGKLAAAPGARNALAARLVEEAGFPAVYMTGAGVANTLLGKPDVGLLTLGEMTMMAHYVAEAVTAPVISDADTGLRGTRSTSSARCASSRPRGWPRSISKTR